MFPSKLFEGNDCSLSLSILTNQVEDLGTSVSGIKKWARKSGMTVCMGTQMGAKWNG